MHTFTSIAEAAAALAAPAAQSVRPLHLAIGMFDGVHLGHQAVIEAAVHSARRSGGTAAVLTFWPHPSRLFRPDAPVRMIMTPALKARLLAQLGVDVIISQTFDAAYAQTPAAEFLPLLKRHLPVLRTIYVGENWRFGRGREGDISYLINEARPLGLSVFSAERINHNGEPISSTRIRAHLETGGIEEANTLLGYSYFAEGVIMPGKQLGRTIGFPTLNVDWQPDLLPRLGVYAVRVTAGTSPGLTSAPPPPPPPPTAAPAAPSFPAVANYGLRPTVENATCPRLEIHLLGDRCPFDAGDFVTVEWLTFLRPEQRFPNLPALRAQIAADRQSALDWFSAQ
ncbi:bifunctional riboflavin kinase/FMN adenylyltransferase [Opitutaceae bacterium TAV3]|nr:bifunctional riboflavin kinase/FMN adenylyltransferase [Opitutaceae bacterium TAV3]